MKFNIAEKGNRCIVRVPTWCCEAPTGSKHATLRLVLGPSERAPRCLARDRAVKLSDVHIKAVEGQSNKAGSGQPSVPLLRLSRNSYTSYPLSPSHQTSSAVLEVSRVPVWASDYQAVLWCCTLPDPPHQLHSTAPRSSGL
jgi:hypothetical protein